MASPTIPAFSLADFLVTAGAGRKTVALKTGQIIFSQGDPADAAFYIQKGRIKLTVLSNRGKEATLALLQPGEFFGEDSIPSPGALRVAIATANMPSTVLRISRKEMVRVIHEERAFSDMFVKFLLARTTRIQEDLVDQLFNSSEKRLARVLLLLAQFGKDTKPQTTIPNITQETLAQMIGTTRSRVNFFMNRFRKLGFIQYNGEIHVHPSLLNVILHD